MMETIRSGYREKEAQVSVILMCTGGGGGFGFCFQLCALTQDLVVESAGSFLPVVQQIHL